MKSTKTIILIHFQTSSLVQNMWFIHRSWGFYWPPTAILCGRDIWMAPKAVLPKGEEDEEESAMLASQLSCQIRGERNTSCNLRWARGARGARRWCIKEEFPSFFNGAGSIIDSLALTPKRLRWRRVERLTRSLSPGVFIGTLECGTGIVWKTPGRSLHAIAQLGVGAASSAWVLNCQTKIHPITPCFQNVFLLFQDFAPGIDNVSQEAGTVMYSDLLFDKPLTVSVHFCLTLNTLNN